VTREDGKCYDIIVLLDMKVPERRYRGECLICRGVEATDISDFLRILAKFDLATLVFDKGNLSKSRVAVWQKPSFSPMSYVICS